LSPDPVLADYMTGRINGGVYRPINLALYTYTWNNPVVLIDPNGRFQKFPELARAAQETAKLLAPTIPVVVAEPTPVGEVVLAGAFVVGVSGYLIYDAVTGGDPPKPSEATPAPAPPVDVPSPPPPAAGGGGAKEPPKPPVAAAAEPEEPPAPRGGAAKATGEAAKAARIDPTKPANEVLPGSLRREFPGQHLNKSLNQIKDLLRTASGGEKRSLQTAKKILEQSERLLEKTRNK